LGKKILTCRILIFKNGKLSNIGIFAILLELNRTKMLSLTFWIDLSFIATLNFQYIPCFCFPKAFKWLYLDFFSSLLKQVRYYLFRRVHVKTLFHWDKLYGRTIWDSQRNRSRKDWWRKGKKIDQKEKDELKHNQPVCWLHFSFYDAA
jgi:hypothetical protein